MMALRRSPGRGDTLSVECAHSARGVDYQTDGIEREEMLNLDEIKQRCEAAKTSRVLCWRDRNPRAPTGDYCYIVDSDSPGVGYHDDGCRTCPVSLAEYAGQDVPELVAEVERLRGLIQGIRDNAVRVDEMNERQMRFILGVIRDRLEEREE